LCVEIKGINIGNGFWIVLAQDTWSKTTYYSQALPKSMEEMSHSETTQKKKIIGVGIIEVNLLLPFKKFFLLIA